MIEKLQLKIPPLLLTLIMGGLIYFVPGTSQLMFSLDAWQLWVGGLLIDAGCLVAIFGVIAFKRAQTTVNPITPEQATQLVNDGVYKFTRNPMYLGFLLALIGWSIFCLNPYGLAFCGLFIWLMNALQIKPEEKALEKLFGEEYRQYCKLVRRWL